VAEDIIEKIDATLLAERNARRFDPFGGDVWDEDRVDRLGDGMRVRAARTGIEEVPEPVDADLPDRFYDALDAALQEVGEGSGRHVATLAAQDEVLRQMAENMPIPLTTLPAERTHIAVTTAFDPEDRIAEAMRAEVRRQGLAPCEIQIDGRTEWLPAESADVRMMTPEEAAGWQATQRLSLECSRRWRGCSGCDGLAMDNFPCMHDCHEPAVCSCPQVDVSTFTDAPTARRLTQGYDPGCRVCPDPYAHALDELVEPERDGPQVFTMPATRGAILEFGGGYYRYACPHSGCVWEKVARFRPHLVDLVEAHDLEQHSRTSWWSRLLPGRRTRR